MPKRRRRGSPLLFDAHKYIRLSPESAVEKFKGIVIKWASYYYSKFTGLLEKDDLISAGNIGVIKAVKSYSPENSRFRLSSFRTYTENYIKWEIKNEISHFAEGISESVSIPVNTRKRGMPCKTNIIKHIPSFVSLDSNVSNDEDGLCLHEIIEDKRDNTEKNAFLAEMWKHINCLPDRQKEVLHLRYKDKGKTLEEVAKTLNLSKERVRQIEEDSIKTLRGLYELK